MERRQVVKHSEGGIDELLISETQEANSMSTINSFSHQFKCPRQFCLRRFHSVMTAVPTHRAVHRALKRNAFKDCCYLLLSGEFHFLFGHCRQIITEFRARRGGLVDCKGSMVRGRSQLCDNDSWRLKGYRKSPKAVAQEGGKVLGTLSAKAAWARTGSRPTFVLRGVHLLRGLYSISTQSGLSKGKSYYWFMRSPGVSQHLS